MSWIKKELGYIKDSFSQIVNGVIVFLLASSGLLCAIYLRFLDLNGTIISFVGIFVEIIALVLSFFILKKHIITKEEKKEDNSNKKSFK
ncbi:MAG: hypothetical protein EAX89_07375 [Candidatus Lokiarchaeota archaeon]|nr:hypothetical protein [Candidatus Lokiarchaeota archaeon]